MQATLYRLVSLVNVKPLTDAAWKAFPDEMHAPGFELSADSADRIAKAMIAIFDAAGQPPADPISREIFGEPDAIELSREFGRGVVGLKTLCRAFDIGIPTCVSDDPQE